MKPPTRAHELHRSDVGPDQPEPEQTFTGTDQDYEDLALLLKQVSITLQQPGLDEVIEAVPEAKAIVERLRADSQRGADIVRFVKADRVASRYNLTSEEFWALVSAQEWRCAICRTEFVPGGPRMNVDHNHTTNEVRSILCSKCNTGLGLFQDNPDLLAMAFAYLHAFGYYGQSVTKDEQ